MTAIKYSNTLKARFISRPNRFIALVDINGAVETVHVKNTGRCKELLTSGAEVILEAAPTGSARKTKYDLIAVYKDKLLINIDSQCPNKAAAEYLPTLFGKDAVIRAEKTYGSSRFDFYIEKGERKIFLEVKGCTLESNGVCSFPDAPTLRGVKHLEELIQAAADGYEAYIFFVIQMEKAKYFTPNYETHPEFAAALKKAADSGVNIIACTSIVTENSLTVDNPLEIRL